MSLRIVFRILAVAAAVLVVVFLRMKDVPGPARDQEPVQQVSMVHGWPLLEAGFAFGQVPGVGVDSHNHVFVFQRGEPPILCFEGESGKLIRSWGGEMFAQPHGLAIDSRNRVWVTDTGHHQVYQFSHEGKLLMTLGVADEAGEDETHFNQPTDVVVSPAGEIYVADGYGNSRVLKFSPEGRFLLQWGVKGSRPGEFDTPHGLAMDSRQRIYVADRGNARIQVFGLNGNFLAVWKGPQLGRPWGVEVGGDGFLYVADGGDMNPRPPDRGRILKLDLSGKVVDSWGSFGSYDGQFYWLHDVAVGPDGAVYGVDVNVGMRIQKFVRR